MRPRIVQIIATRDEDGAPMLFGLSNYGELFMYHRPHKPVVTRGGSKIDGCTGGWERCPDGPNEVIPYSE